MPSPSTSQSTLRPDLGGSFMEYDLLAAQQGYIAHRVLPVFETMKQSGPFGKIPIEQLLQDPDTTRAPGAGYSRGDWTFTKDNFACDEEGHEEPVDDRERQMYRDFFDAELISAQRAMTIVQRAAEIRAAALIFNTTTWTGAALTTAVSVKWDVPATATPIIDVKNAKKKVWDGSGLWPDALVCSQDTFNELANTAEIIDRIKYWGGDDPKIKGVTEQVMARALGLREVIVAGCPKNTAAEGQSAVLASIWSDTQAMVCKVARSNDIREPAIGRTFHWGEDGSMIGGTVESYRSEDRRSDIIRVRHDVDEKVLYVEAGHLLTGVQ